MLVGPASSKSFFEAEVRTWPAKSACGSPRSGLLLEGCGETFECHAHRAAVALCSIVDARHLLAELQHRLGSEVVAPLGDSASRLGWLEPIAPSGEVKIAHGALEGKGHTWFGLDDLALCGPLKLAVAIVPVEDGPYDWAVEPVVPLTRMALLRPLAHAGDIRNCGIGLLGGSGYISGDLNSVRHVDEFTTQRTLEQLVASVAGRKVAAAVRSSPRWSKR